MSRRPGCKGPQVTATEACRHHVTGLSRMEGKGALSELLQEAAAFLLGA